MVYFENVVPTNYGVWYLCTKPYTIISIVVNDNTRDHLQMNHFKISIWPTSTLTTDISFKSWFLISMYILLICLYYISIHNTTLIIVISVNHTNHCSWLIFYLRWTSYKLQQYRYYPYKIFKDGVLRGFRKCRPLKRPRRPDCLGLGFSLRLGFNGQATSSTLDMLQPCLSARSRWN